MKCGACGQHWCVCLKSTKPILPCRETFHSQPFGITREQLGPYLYEAIKRVGAIKQLQHYMSLLMEHSGGLTAMREREQAQRRELAAILPRLTDREDAELRTQYPEVITW